jgi:hypothetical protein
MWALQITNIMTELLNREMTGGRGKGWRRILSNKILNHKQQRYGNVTRKNSKLGGGGGGGRGGANDDNDLSLEI